MHLNIKPPQEIVLSPGFSRHILVREKPAKAGTQNGTQNYLLCIENAK
jgi:hypothetical protein